MDTVRATNKFYTLIDPAVFTIVYPTMDEVTPILERLDFAAPPELRTDWDALIGSCRKLIPIVLAMGLLVGFFGLFRQLTREGRGLLSRLPNVIRPVLMFYASDPFPLCGYKYLIPLVLHRMDTRRHTF